MIINYYSMIIDQHYDYYDDYITVIMLIIIHKGIVIYVNMLAVIDVTPSCSSSPHH